MQDNSTRSGLLWEVERILGECKELEKQGKGYMPNILLMENVIQVHSEKDKEHFIKWINRLEELGYQSYWQDLIATDFEIPQTRNRCFMISIYGDYTYNFPKPVPLKLRLKDLLEEEVDEKYYLSEKMLDYCFGVNQKESKFPRGERFLQSLEQTNDKDIATTITTNAGNRPTDNFIKIKNNNSKGYLVATEGDGIDISSRMEHHRGTVQKNKSQTLTTAGGNDVGVVVGAAMRGRNGKQQIEMNGQELSNALTTVQKDTLVAENSKPKVLGGVGEKDSNNNTQWKQQNRIYDDNVAISVTTSFNPYYVEKEPTVEIPLKRGYSCEVKEEKADTDQIDVIGNYSKSNYVQTSVVGKNGIAPTVTENHGQVTAIVEEKEIGFVAKHYQNFVKEKGYVPEMFNPYNEADLDNIAPTQSTQCGSSTSSAAVLIVDDLYKNRDTREYKEASPALRAGRSGLKVKKQEFQSELRIRKLTPKECLRLMGLKDQDIELISEHQTNALLYHLAGDSIVVNVLMAIFKQLL